MFIVSPFSDAGAFDPAVIRAVNQRPFNGGLPGSGRFGP
jgi:hypothetical protein